MPEDLASFRRCVERINTKWPNFIERRQERLAQQGRFGAAAEKVTEGIIEDLFTGVLDWTLADLNNQVEFADILLSSLGIKYLLLEAKRPGALAWSRPAVESALDQARRYADEQRVSTIAISDGVMLYAADVQHCGLHDRLFVALDQAKPCESLWWISMHGIYRTPPSGNGAALRPLPDSPAIPESTAPGPASETLLDPRHHLPARCFAYVADASDPRTWKLPYCLRDATIDAKRLPKAIQAILSNYRGAKVSGIPEHDIPPVLNRLADAARQCGKMPDQCGDPAPIYRQLAQVLEQVNRTD